MRKAGEVFASVAAAVLLAPGGAQVAVEPALAAGRCACDASALVAFHDQIASAGTLAEAQQLDPPGCGWSSWAEASSSPHELSTL